MEQFDKLCEVQSDKASVEVNSAGFSFFLFSGGVFFPLVRVPGLLAALG